MVKACNCLGGGAIAHRDCLEDWEDEDKCISKNVDEGKKGGTTENRGSENRKTKMVDGIIVDVIDNASLPVTPSGTRSWKVLDDSPGKKCRARCGFGGLASGGIKNAKEGEAIIQTKKECSPKRRRCTRRTRKPCEETDQVRLKRYQTLRKKMRTASVERQRTNRRKKRRNPAREGEGARVKRKENVRPKTAEIDDEQARKEAARRKGYNFNRAFFAKRCQSEERKKESLTSRFCGRE